METILEVKRTGLQDSANECRELVVGAKEQGSKKEIDNDRGERGEEIESKAESRKIEIDSGGNQGGRRQ